MIDALFNQPNYVAAQKLLDAAVVRHQAIASNIANVETPHYKRVDLNPGFGTELTRALSSGSVPSVKSLRPTVSTDTTAAAESLDGNTVKLETELVHLAENHLSHTVQSQLITGSLLKLRLAITGRSA